MHRMEFLTLVLFGFAGFYLIKPGSPALAPPNCTIFFDEEGQIKLTHNVTKLDVNTYVVQFNKTKPHDRWDTDDSPHFTRVFGDEDNFPPYAHMFCTAPYPAKFEFDGVGALDFFRVYKGGNRTFDYLTRFCKSNATVFDKIHNNCEGFFLGATVLMTPQATGRYTFHSLTDRNLSTSYFLFAEAKSRPYLLGASSTRSHVLRPRIVQGTDNTTAVILPCVASNYGVRVNLYRRVPRAVTGFSATSGSSQGSAWVQIRSRAIRYDPKRGFVVTFAGNASMALQPGVKNVDLVPGLYKCTTGSEWDSDFVLIDVNANNTGPQVLSNTSSVLSISIVNRTAVCKSSSSSGNSSSWASVIEMSNMNTKNAAETRLLAECMQKGNSYCGSHSYHQRKRATVCEESNCVQIQGIHRQGLLFCVQGRQHLITEYFTGLDGIIYTDWKQAPLLAVLRPTIEPVPLNFTDTEDEDEDTTSTTTAAPIPLALRTGIQYQVFCDSVMLLTVRDPFIVHIRYKNGSLIQLAELIFWSYPKKLYLTPDMVGISCNDYLWDTYEPVNSSISITVKDEDCERNEFKCLSNGQCISDDEVCDLHEHCEDGSDEKPPICQKFVPTLVQGPRQITFAPNTRNDLICDLANALPPHLRARIHWQYKEKNITDNHRLWQDLNGQRLLLRFNNASSADEGEYKCVATNSLGSAEYKVNIRVQQVVSTTTTTTSPTTERTTTRYALESVRLVPTDPPPVHVPDSYEAEPDEMSGGGHAVTIGVVIITLAVVVTLAGGAYMGWRYYGRSTSTFTFRWPRIWRGAPRILTRPRLDDDEQTGSGTAYRSF